MGPPAAVPPTLRSGDTVSLGRPAPSTGPSSCDLSPDSDPGFRRVTKLTHYRDLPALDTPVSDSSDWRARESTESQQGLGQGGCHAWDHHAQTRCAAVVAFASGGPAHGLRGSGDNGGCDRRPGGRGHDIESGTVLANVRRPGRHWLRNRLLAVERPAQHNIRRSWSERGHRCASGGTVAPTRHGVAECPSPASLRGRQACSHPGCLIPGAVRELRSSRPRLRPHQHISGWRHRRERPERGR